VKRLPFVVFACPLCIGPVVFQSVSRHARSAAALIGTFAVADGSKDCALLVYLPSGSDTAQISGVANTTGVALVEVYEVP